MIKIFKDVCPRRLNEEIDKEILKTTLDEGIIKIPEGYDCDHDYDNQVYQQTINLHSFLDCHGVDLPIGVTCDPNEMYPGWQLIIDTENHRGSFDAIVSRFFTWSAVENQYILDFDELVNDEWC